MVYYESSNPLQEHLEHCPACPIALAIQQRGLEIEEDAKQEAKDITKTTLAQLAQQSEIHRGNVQARLSQQQTPLPSTKKSTPLETKEAHLLEFYRHNGPKKEFNPWRLGSNTLKDMPQCNEASIWVRSPIDPKLFQAITAVVGKGGIKNGWFVTPPVFLVWLYRFLALLADANSERAGSSTTSIKLAPLVDSSMWMSWL